jgi:hypothetical protein
MTSHVARLYALTTSLLALFVGWAAIAARPWQEPGSAPAPPTLVRYEQRLDETARLVADLTARRQQTTPPAVRVVTLPPLTTTRTS